MKPFTEEDLDACWPYYKTYLLELLNREYDIEEAIKDLRSLVGHHKYDPRCKVSEKPK